MSSSPSSTEDPPSRGMMHVKFVEAQSASGGVKIRRGFSSGLDEKGKKEDVRAADSGQSGWPDIVSMVIDNSIAVFARRRSKSNTN
ncbi:hypothetical protein TNCV_817401 [Trichonephila clavipes]|nr:hypothetical protein TNCV_817401 [Trichonephila clavipes]